jgi:hypothetical protein
MTREELLKRTLEELGKRYPPGMYAYLHHHHPEAYQELLNLESTISQTYLTGTIGKLKEVLRLYWRFHITYKGYFLNSLKSSGTTLEKPGVVNLRLLTLTELSRRNMAVEVYSELLGQTIWLCSNEEMVSHVLADDPQAVCYTAEEIRQLLRLRPTPGDIKRIHEVKTAFPESSIVKSSPAPEDQISGHSEACDCPSCIPDSWEDTHG